MTFPNLSRRFRSARVNRIHAWRQRLRSSPRLERLEDRTVPAGVVNDVTVTLLAGSLYIDGDGEGNGLVIEQTGLPADTYRLSSASGYKTRINGSDVPLVVAGVTRSITMKLNEGDDFVELIGTGSTALAGDLSYKGGIGDDSLKVSGLKVAWNLSLAGEEGADAIELNGVTAKKLSMDLGEGDGIARIDDVTITGSAGIQWGTGSADANIHKLNVSSALSIDFAGGVGTTSFIEIDSASGSTVGLKHGGGGVTAAFSNLNATNALNFSFAGGATAESLIDVQGVTAAALNFNYGEGTVTTTLAALNIGGTAGFNWGAGYHFTALHNASFGGLAGFSWGNTTGADQLNFDKVNAAGIHFKHAGGSIDAAFNDLRATHALNFAFAGGAGTKSLVEIKKSRVVPALAQGSADALALNFEFGAGEVTTNLSDLTLMGATRLKWGEGYHLTSIHKVAFGGTAEIKFDKVSSGFSDEIEIESVTAPVLTLKHAGGSVSASLTDLQATKAIALAFTGGAGTESKIEIESWVAPNVNLGYGHGNVATSLSNLAVQRSAVLKLGDGSHFTSIHKVSVGGNASFGLGRATEGVDEIEVLSVTAAGLNFQQDGGSLDATFGDLKVSRALNFNIAGGANSESLIDVPGASAAALTFTYGGGNVTTTLSSLKVGSLVHKAGSGTHALETSGVSANSMQIQWGAGDGSATIDKTTVNGNLSIQVGKAVTKHVVSVGTAGAVAVKKNLVVLLGDGANEVSMAAVQVTRDFLLNSGGGSDDVALGGSAVGLFSVAGAATVNTGKGNDLLRLGTEPATATRFGTNLQVFMGDGNDQMELSEKGATMRLPGAFLLSGGTGANSLKAPRSVLNPANPGVASRLKTFTTTIT